MTFPGLLKKQHFSTNIFCLDPSLTCTGHCLLACNHEGIRIERLGLIQVDDKLTEDERVLQISQEICRTLLILRPRLVIIEKPPGTTYGIDNASKVARASSIYKLFTLYGSLITAIKLAGFDYRSLLPISWQASLKKKGCNIKQRSMYLANQRLEGQVPYYKGRRRHRFMLQRNIDANMADAINLGFHYWNNRITDV